MGLGVRHLSVSPPQIPEVRELLRATEIGRTAAVARECLTLTSAREVRQRVEAEMAEVLAEARPPGDGGRE